LRGNYILSSAPLPSSLSLFYSDGGSVVIALIVAFCAIVAWSFHVERRSVAPDALRKLYDSKVLISGDPVEINGPTRQTGTDGRRLFSHAKS